MTEKALLIPFNSKHEIFLQDRTDYKPPPWGFFGGGVEAGETPLQAVIRETKEELNIELTTEDLMYIGEYHTIYNDKQINRHMFLWCTDQEEFTVLEGAGGAWLNREAISGRLIPAEHFEAIWEKIMQVTN